MQETSTILIEPGCQAEITKYGDVSIRVSAKDGKADRDFRYGGAQVGRRGKTSRLKSSTRVDPIQLSVFSNLFMSIAEQMGRILERTSISVNIKERLDFSCAIFDETGGLVANAPHVPVHLGAMSEAVRPADSIAGEQFESRRRAGDEPSHGRRKSSSRYNRDHSCLAKQKTNLFSGQPGPSCGNRRHFSRVHAAFFSAPGRGKGPASRVSKLVSKGSFNEAGIRQLLFAPGMIRRAPDQAAISGTRRISDNISDLKAQVAANQTGVELLLEMIDHYSLPVTQAYMHHIQSNAEQAVRNMFQQLSLSRGLAEVDTVCAEDFLDDGSPIALRLTIDRRNGSAIF